MRWLHFSRAMCAAIGIVLPAAAAAQPADSPDAASTFTVFLRAQPIGSEQIAVLHDADGWSIVSSGRLGAPVDTVARRVEVHYTEDWHPVEMSIDATIRGQAQMLHTVVTDGTAQTEFTLNGQPSQKTERIDPAAVLIVPTAVFAPYEALAHRLKTAAPGSEIPIYTAPLMAFVARVGESSSQQIQTIERMVDARRTRITLAAPGAPVEADIWTDDTGRMIRLSVPAQSLEVVREDIAAISSRSVPISRTNDETVRIPSNGFTLAGTVSKPVDSSPARRPAVVLVGGSGPTDRDGLAYGIPVLGEIAGALADAGYVVIRYDKRGIGQSGGRAESASYADYAEDIRAAVKALSQRKDVDPKRIAVIGHSEGGSVALMAAAKEKRIAAVALLATPGVTGSELVLAQQKRVLDRSTMSAEEKQAKVDAQKRIHEAVITGKGLEQLPPDVRRAVDNPEFQSILVADPAKLVPNVRKPLLIVQGELDTQVEPSNADRLEELAHQRKNSPPVDVVKIPGVNHLLASAKTGETDEYGKLPDRHVSREVTKALLDWLKKTL